ncbi:MAG: transglutaminase N-terminal domain-containing protein, partial [Pseudomonadota bacterium]
MLLQIRHETTYHYEPAPKDLALCLRLFPQNTAQQSVVDWRVVVNDEPISPLLVTGLGEAQALWFNRRASDTVRVVAEGKVETTDQAGVLGKHSGYRAGIFLRETPLTEAGEAVAALC